MPSLKTLNIVIQISNIMADIAIGHNESIKNKIFKAVKSRNSTKTPVKRLSNRLGKKQPKKITCD